MVRVPASGTSAPAMILMSVDLPAPFSPTSAWTSPRASSKDTPLSARRPANDFVMEVAWTSALTYLYLPREPQSELRVATIVGGRDRADGGVGDVGVGVAEVVV